MKSDVREKHGAAGARRLRAAVALSVAAAAGFLLRGACAPSEQGRAGTGPDPVVRAAEVWTCSMHPQVRRDGPGACPICGMDLVPLEEGVVGETPVLVVGPEAAALMRVETSPVERRFPVAEIRMVGKISYDETRRRYVTAWVPGRIDRLFVDYEGVAVREGDHLVDVYSPALLAAQEELLLSRRALDELERSSLQVLRDSAAATFDEAYKKLVRWGMTEEQIDELPRAGVASDHTTIYARRGGVVTEKLVKEGVYVDEGTRIYAIDDLSHLWVRFDAYESELAWLHYGQRVEFETEAYPGLPFRGTVAFIDRALDSMTRTVKVRVNVSNEDGLLKPGMFVRGVVRARLAGAGRLMDPDLAGRWICPMHPEVVKEEPGECDVCGMALVTTESLGYAPAEPGELEPPLVVPKSAVLRTGRRAVVYVQVPEAESPTFEGREVVLGPRAGDVYLVREGLQEGELVVTRGNFKIDSALEIQAKPSMMSMPSEPAESGEEEAPSALAAPPGARALLERLWSSYADLQEALAGDDGEAARRAASELRSWASEPTPDGLGAEAAAVWSEARGRLQEAVESAAAASELADARTAFAAVHAAAAELFVAFGAPTAAPLHVVHCPMAFGGRGADWLQADAEVRNPYYGAAMLACGSVTGEIPPAGGDE